jgi:hypothetical protein
VQPKPYALRFLPVHPQPGSMPAICPTSLPDRSASFARLRADRVAVLTGGAQVEEVDRFLGREVIEAYEDFCENRLLPASALPR